MPLSTLRKLVPASILTAIAVAACLAQATPDGGQYPWEGEVTGSNVYVRSGAGANWYPTAKLNAGDRVLVLGEKFGWYRVTPPPDSFSFIDTATVERNAGGGTGTVKQDKVYVRAGSHLESRKSATQIVLNKGATVEIIGEAEGFFKIKPPPGAALYISKQYVKPIEPRMGSGLVQRHQVAAASETQNPADGAPPASAEPKTQPAVDPASPAAPQSAQPTELPEGRIAIPPAEPESAAFAAQSGMAPLDPLPSASGNVPANEADGQLAQPAAGLEPAPKIQDIAAPRSKPPARSSSAGGSNPAQKPAPASGRYQATLTVLEGELVTFMAQPFDERDPIELIKRYQEVASQDAEIVPQAVARIRIRQLQDRSELRESRLALKSQRAELETYRANMESERMKIMRRRTEEALVKYDLEGELRRSLAFAPENRRFRLVDPATQSTIAYVDIPRSVEHNVDHLIGRMVGVRAAGQSFSPSARVPVAVAGSIVDLTPRKLNHEQAPPGQSSKATEPTDGGPSDASDKTAVEAPVGDVDKTAAAEEGELEPQ